MSESQFADGFVARLSGRILLSTAYVVILCSMLNANVYAQQIAETIQVAETERLPLIPLYQSDGGVRIHSVHDYTNRVLIPILASNPENVHNGLTDVQLSILESWMRTILNEIELANADTLGALTGNAELDSLKQSMSRMQMEMERDLEMFEGRLVALLAENYEAQAVPDSLGSRRANRLNNGSAVGTGLLSEQLRMMDARYERRFDELSREIASMNQAARKNSVTVPVVPLPVQQPKTIDVEAMNRIPSFADVERALLQDGIFRTATVLFEFDDSALIESSRSTLDMVGAVMKEYPDIAIEIVGHTDSSGPAEYNQNLSVRRAESVRTYLSQNFGLGASRVTARGGGENFPIASNDNRTGRALNRRVEFEIISRGE